MCLFSSSRPSRRIAVGHLPETMKNMLSCMKISIYEFIKQINECLKYLLRRFISTGFVLCSQGPASSSTSDGSREEPLVVVTPLVWFSLLLGLLADTGLVTIHYTIQSKISYVTKLYAHTMKLSINGNIYLVMVGTCGEGDLILYFKKSWYYCSTIIHKTPNIAS